MRNLRRPLAAASAFAVIAGLAAVPAAPVAADSTPRALPLAQAWSTTTLLGAEDDWNAVPGIVGRRGDDLTTATGTNPGTIVADGSGTPLDLIPNRTDPNTFATGGVAEFELDDPVVALQGSGTADAPHLVVALDATGQSAIRVRYRLRDIDAGLNTDGTPVDTNQQVALHYRVGGTGTWTNVPAAYVADASRPGAGFTTDVDVTLPADADGAPLLDLRVMTTNAVGSDEWIGVDDLVIDTTGAVDALPVATCPATVAVVEGDGAGRALSASDEDSTIASAAITSAPVPGISLDATDPAAPTLIIDPVTAPGRHPVTVTFATDDAEPQTVSCDIEVSIEALVPVHDVQGSGPTSPLLDRTVIVEGVVTGTISTDDAINGFFLQAPASDIDDDPSTSEGVYVYCASACAPAVASGDGVRVAGRVGEFNGSTQIATSGGGAIEVRSAANRLPDATNVAFTSTPTTDAAAFEHVEGMLTRFPETLTVSEFFQLARFGQIELVAGDRPATYTHVAVNPTRAGNTAYLAELAARSIVLEDDSDDANDMVSGPQRDEPYPFPTPGLAAGDRFRAGDTIAGMTGVMQYAFGAWRQRAVEGVEYEFEPANPAPTASPDVDGRLAVVGFNVLNYFATVDTTPGNTGPCGPAGTADCRGADSDAERRAQLAKMVVALADLDADVYGLTEIENDSGLATQQIVDALNATTAPGTYAFVNTGAVGTDAIKVAIVYRTTAVTPVGTTRVMTSADDPTFVDTLNRPPVIQTFEELATGERFTVAVNHLKSKGSACAGDPDIGDGAGNCNVTRTNAATAEAAFLATNPTGTGDGDVLIIGDLNAYRNEDPIKAITAAGYTDLTRELVGEDAYSYLFDGMLGYLDHALATATLTSQVSGVGEWHVNADENPLFDYNDDVFDAGEASFDEESAAFPLAGPAPDPFRTSDHDPVVVGLALASLAVHDAVIVQSPRGGGTLLLDGTVIGERPSTCPAALTIRVGDTTVDLGPTTRIGRTSTCALLTSKGLVTYDRATGAIAGLVALPSSFRLGDGDVTLRVLVDGASHAVVQDGRRTGLVWVAAT